MVRLQCVNDPGWSPRAAGGRRPQR